ncbi:MAG: squalene/phytoene synthase family protein [Symploca sp. SIO3E6]|nr:squalene/phytoene synthase family protein [Caldora sp. SIO3E6]
MSLYFSNQQKEYLETWMNNVSRSFALITPCFEEPLDSLMATAYLICRVADNIEDSLQSFEWKQARFAELKLMMQEPLLASNILSKWLPEDWLGLESIQKQFLQENLMLWQIYRLMPNISQTIVRRWVMTIIEGMEQMLNPLQAPINLSDNGVRLLKTEKDYEDYCYFVAGTVGHMGTELAINQYNLSLPISTRLIDSCEFCGKGLQKTNIIKDFREDLNRGLCYLPDIWMQEVDRMPLYLQGASKFWKKKVLTNVLIELDKSVEYVKTIPYQAAGYRLASLMCLLPAYQTILSAAQKQEHLFTPQHNIKISRNCFSDCIKDAKNMVKDNEALLNYSQQLQKSIKQAF